LFGLENNRTLIALIASIALMYKLSLFKESTLCADIDECHLLNIKCWHIGF
jgi:hypothetical protein